MVEILQKELSYNINGILFKIHNSLGRFCKHNQYGDALEALLKENNIKYKREIEVPILFNGIKLTGNILDFLIEDVIVLDIKCKKDITTKDYVQMKNQYPNNKLKQEMLFTHIFKNEEPVLEIKRMFEEYKYPDIDTCVELYKSNIKK